MIPQTQAQRQGDLLPKRLPLIIEPSNRDTTTGKDARLVNCYMETHGQGQGMEHWIYKRPGFFDSGTGQAASTGRGVFNWRGNIYSIFGSTFYKNGVNKGTVDTTNGVYRFSSDFAGATTPKQLQLGNGVKAYNFDDASGLVQITDVDFPTSFVKGWAFLDETTYVMVATSASIQGSALNNTTSWDALNVLQAEIEPDDGVALGKQLVNVVALKQWTTEVFYDAGNATASPLGRVPGAKVNYGCVSADSVQDCDGILVWLAQARNASASVVAMDNLKAVPVSDRPVERLLEGVDFTSNVYSWYIKIEGHRFYGLTLKNANLTLVYDLQERFWSQWTDSAGNYFPMVSATFDTPGGAAMRRIMQHESNGKLYYVTHNTSNDDGVAIQADVYTPNFDGGVRRRKVMNFLEFIGDQQLGSVLQVRSSDDDYQTWSNFRRVDLSQKRPHLTNCGTFYRRAHHFRHTSNTPLRLQAVEMQLDLGVL